MNRRAQPWSNCWSSTSTITALASRAHRGRGDKKVVEEEEKEEEEEEG